MTWTVIWRPPALAELAEAWNTSPDRAGVTAASNRIDRLLATDPLTAGESRDGEDRIVFDAPLAVIFRVDRAARMVFVLTVGLYGRRA
jgi:hypothetical protein